MNWVYKLYVMLDAPNIDDNLETPEVEAAPLALKLNLSQPRHSDEIQDVITMVPSWLVRWGMTILAMLLALLFLLGIYVRYPETIYVPANIYSENSPDAVIMKIPGKIVSLNVHDGDWVAKDSILGFIESTANHADVIQTCNKLHKLREDLLNGKSFDIEDIGNPQLGELQDYYNAFVESYLLVKPFLDRNYRLKQEDMLKNDLDNLGRERNSVILEKKLLNTDFKLAESEYAMHQKLAKEKVETVQELREAESKYISKKTALLQSDEALANVSANYTVKSIDLQESDKNVAQARTKAEQAINTFLSQAAIWKDKYLLIARQCGFVNFNGPTPTDRFFTSGQIPIYILPKDNGKYLAELAINQENIGKIKDNQTVLIRLTGYPFEEFGMLKGKISSVSKVAINDSAFEAYVTLNPQSRDDDNQRINLKTGLSGEAEIIVSELTVFDRMRRALFKLTHLQ